MCHEDMKNIEPDVRAISAATGHATIIGHRHSTDASETRSLPWAGWHRWNHPVAYKGEDILHATRLSNREISGLPMKLLACLIARIGTHAFRRHTCEIGQGRAVDGEGDTICKVWVRAWHHPRSLILWTEHEPKHQLFCRQWPHKSEPSSRPPLQDSLFPGLPAGTPKATPRWWVHSTPHSNVSKCYCCFIQTGLLIENERQDSGSPIIFVLPVVQSFMQQHGRIKRRFSITFNHHVIDMS